MALTTVYFYESVHKNVRNVRSNAFFCSIFGRFSSYFDATVRIAHSGQATRLAFFGSSNGTALSCAGWIIEGGRATS